MADYDGDLCSNRNGVVVAMSAEPQATAIVKLTLWEVRRLMEALQEGSQQSDDQAVWRKLARAAGKLA